MSETPVINASKDIQCLSLLCTDKRCLTPIPLHLVLHSKHSLPKPVSTTAHVGQTIFPHPIQLSSLPSNAPYSGSSSMPPIDISVDDDSRGPSQSSHLLDPTSTDGGGLMVPLGARMCGAGSDQNW